MNYLIGGILILALLFWILPRLLPQNRPPMFNVIFLISGLLLGLALAWIVLKSKWGFGKADETTIQSNTIVQSIERVFKVVTAEGHFSEVYEYENTTHTLSFIPSTKKALIVVNAKVLMGFDFKKLKVEIDESDKSIKILSFPEPEILSVEPDLRYYSLENGLLNKFSNKDLTMLQADAKAKIIASVSKSDLPAIAQKQMHALMLELADLRQMALQGEDKIIQAPLQLNSAQLSQ